MPAAFDDLGKAGSDQVQLAKFPELKVITHLHTAANSPAMCDAAAVLMIGSSDFAERQGLRPIARIVDTVTCCAEPLEVVSGCVEATKPFSSVIDYCLMTWMSLRFTRRLLQLLSSFNESLRLIRPD
jgi:hypothetical protein